MLRKKLSFVLGVPLAAAMAIMGASVPASAAGTLPPVSPSGTITADRADTGSTKIAPPATYGKWTTPPAPSASAKVAPGGVYAPKGKVGPGGKNSLLRQSTKAAGSSKLLTTSFFYGSAHNFPAASPATDGVSANLVIGNPYLAAGDYHSLGEITAQSANGQQIVEVGWTKDPTVCGASTPLCLFVYHWVNGATSCYNGCGWVDNAAVATNAGAALTGGASKQFQILQSSNVWWISYDGQWIGYFPNTLWTGASPPVTFNTVGLAQGFNEVAASSTAPCTDMGTGQPASSTSAARVGTWNLHTSSGWALTAFGSGPATSGPVAVPAINYSVSPLSTSTFRVGGPGFC